MNDLSLIGDSREKRYKHTGQVGLLQARLEELAAGPIYLRVRVINIPTFSDIKYI